MKWLRTELSKGWLSKKKKNGLKKLLIHVFYWLCLAFEQMQLQSLTVKELFLIPTMEKKRPVFHLKAATLTYKELTDRNTDSSEQHQHLHVFHAAVELLDDLHAELLFI